MSTLVELAKALAFHYHKDQKYGDYPYSKHLEKVAMNIQLFANNNEDLLCAAYLHDILEDTDIDEAVIYHIFGYKILDIVRCLTKYSTNYEEYIEQLVTNSDAILVKYCDTLANLTQSVDDGNVKRIGKYTKQLELLADYLAWGKTE